MAMSEAMSRRIRAIFNSFNFWTIVLYNIVALNSVDFAKVVAKRLLLKGTPPALHFLRSAIQLEDVDTVDRTACCVSHPLSQASPSPRWRSCSSPTASFR